MRANERLDQRLVAARLPCRRRHSLRRHDQLPATAALQPDRDADGQSVDLKTRAPGHYSAASSKGSERPDRSLLVRQLRDEAANPGSMQRDGDAVRRDIDPLDQQPHDACLLGRIELVPYRLERSERFDDIALLELGSLAAPFSRRTAVIVRATSSGDASSRRTCPSTKPSTSLAASERTGQVSWPLRLAPRQT